VLKHAESEVKPKMRDLNEYCIDCGVSTTILSFCGIPAITVGHRYKEGIRCTNCKIIYEEELKMIRSEKRINRDMKKVFRRIKK